MRWLMLNDNSLVNLWMLRHIITTEEEDFEDMIYYIEYWYGENDGECFLETYDNENDRNERFSSLRKLLEKVF